MNHREYLSSFPSLEMLVFRFSLPTPTNDLAHINESGYLAGQMKPVIEEAFIYLILKLNLTWIPLNKTLRTSDDITIEGVNLIHQDRADGGFCALTLLNGLPKNVTAGPVVSEAWCKIATSPKIISTMLTGGPESALKQIKPVFLVPTIIGLFIMIQLAEMIVNRNNILVSIWLLFGSLVRQNVPSVLRKSSIVGYSVLITSAFLIQILFGSSLHTERTSISTFVRINSFEDLRSHNMTKFILDVSPCNKVVTDDPEYQVIPLVESYLTGQDYSWCIGTGKCALLMNIVDFNLLSSLLCSLSPEKAFGDSFYASPQLSQVLGGYFLNGRILKGQQDRINSYIQRSFEMGLEKKKSFTSRSFGMRAAKTVTPLGANQECLSKSIQNSFSLPVPLRIQFLKKSFILLFMVMCLSFIIVISFVSFRAINHRPRLF